MGSHAQWPKTLSPKRMKNNILAEWEMARKMDAIGGKWGLVLAAKNRMGKGEVAGETDTDSLRPK